MLRDSCHGSSGEPHCSPSHDAQSLTSGAHLTQTDDHKEAPGSNLNSGAGDAVAVSFQTDQDFKPGRVCDFRVDEFQLYYGGLYSTYHDWPDIDDSLPHVRSKREEAINLAAAVAGTIAQKLSVYAVKPMYATYGTSTIPVIVALVPNRGPKIDLFPQEFIPAIDVHLLSGNFERLSGLRTGRDPIDIPQPQPFPTQGSALATALPGPEISAFTCGGILFGSAGGSQLAENSVPPVYILSVAHPYTANRQPQPKTEVLWPYTQWRIDGLKEAESAYQGYCEQLGVVQGQLHLAEAKLQDLTGTDSIEEAIVRAPQTGDAKLKEQRQLIQKLQAHIVFLQKHVDATTQDTRLPMIKELQDLQDTSDVVAEVVFARFGPTSLARELTEARSDTKFAPSPSASLTPVQALRDVMLARVTRPEMVQKLVEYHSRVRNVSSKAGPLTPGQSVVRMSELATCSPGGKYLQHGKVSPVPLFYGLDEGTVSTGQVRGPVSSTPMKGFCVQGNERQPLFAPEGTSGTLVYEYLGYVPVAMIAGLFSTVTGDLNLSIILPLQDTIEFLEAEIGEELRFQLPD